LNDTKKLCEVGRVLKHAEYHEELLYDDTLKYLDENLKSHGEIDSKVTEKS